jgi:hypothetical protein
MTTANGNTIIGVAAGTLMTTGYMNVAVGRSALFSTDTGFGNVAVGYLSGDAITSGVYNTCMGVGAGGDINIGTFNTMLGYSAGGGITTGTHNTIIGGVFGLASGLSNTIILGDGAGNIRYYVNSSGNTAIGKTSPINAKLDVNGDTIITGSLSVVGDITATGNVTAYFSDDRLKTRLGPIVDPLAKIKSLTGFYFEPNQTAMDLGYEKKTDVGISAQDVHAIFPEIIAPAPIDSKYMTVRYEKLIPLLIEAIKDQQLQIEHLRSLIQPR